MHFLGKLVDYKRTLGFFNIQCVSYEKSKLGKM